MVLIFSGKNSDIPYRPGMPPSQVSSVYVGMKPVSVVVVVVVVLFAVLSLYFESQVITLLISSLSQIIFCGASEAKHDYCL